MYDKASVYKYREKHPDIWREQNKKNLKAYYVRNKERLLTRAKERYYAKKTLKNEGLLEVPEN